MTIWLEEIALYLTVAAAHISAPVFIVFSPTVYLGLGKHMKLDEIVFESGEKLPRKVTPNGPARVAIGAPAFTFCVIPAQNRCARFFTNLISDHYPLATSILSWKILLVQNSSWNTFMFVIVHWCGLWLFSWEASTSMQSALQYVQPIDACSAEGVNVYTHMASFTFYWIHTRVWQCWQTAPDLGKGIITLQRWLCCSVHICEDW